MKKDNLATRVAKEMKKRLSQGKWTTRLPGIRALCDEMQVSRQTMMKALQLLEVEGVLLPVEPGKSRLISNVPVVSDVSQVDASHVEYRRIGMVVAMPVSDMEGCDKRSLSALREVLRNSGRIPVEIIFEPLMGSKGGGLADTVAAGAVDLYIVVGADGRWAKWFNDEQEKPVVYIGGDSKGGSRVCYDLFSMCEFSVSELVTLGHSRIVFLLPDLFTKKIDSLPVLQAQLAALLERNGLPHSSYNTPRRGGTVAECYTNLEKVFCWTPPTAIVVHDVSDIPIVVSFLLRHGLKYPEDVSIICLYEGESLAQFYPPIGHLVKDDEALISYVLRQIDLVSNGLDMDESLELVSVMHKCGSVAGVKKSKR